MQAVSAAVQVFASFFIGNIVELVGSMRWTIISLYFLSFVGNFLYSCGGAISPGTLLGGRIICGTASASGAVIFSYITSVTTEKEVVFKLVAIYRTSAGICMALSQVVAILFGLLDFKIRGYQINSYNAPTFAASFFILAICSLLVIVLEDPGEKPKKGQNTNFFAVWKQFFSTKRSRLFSCLILLWCMFLSSFIMSEVMYFMPVFLTLHLDWQTKFQGVSFMIASILGVAGSYFAPKLIHTKLFTKSSKIIHSESESTHSNELEKQVILKTKEIEKDSLYVNQVKFSLFSLIVALIGQAFMIGASESLKHNSLPATNSGVFFVAGLSVTMIGYNFLASSIPALFSMHIDPSLKLQLMPSVGAISGIGKLVSPIVLAALYKTRLGLPIGVGFGMILVAISIPPLYWLRIKRF